MLKVVLKQNGRDPNGNHPIQKTTRICESYATAIIVIHLNINTIIIYVIYHHHYRYH